MPLIRRRNELVKLLYFLFLAFTINNLKASAEGNNFDSLVAEQWHVDDRINSECDCGSNSTNCKFSEDGKKICTCDPGFVPGNYSICTPMCSDEHSCKNRGKCLNDICICLAGTGGPYCEIIYDCEKGLCGNKSDVFCRYDELLQRAFCQCNLIHHEFDIYDKSCKKCSCGSKLGKDWERCDFLLGKKQCQCTQGYSYNPRTEKCSKCYCGNFSNSCSFGNKGEKICRCEEGYIDHLGTCEECDCGTNGICQLKRKDDSAIKQCTCDFGFQYNNGTCLKCECGMNGECSFDSNGNFSKCICDSGFAESSGKCEFCYCGAKSKCSFQNRNKMCICAKGYKEDEGYCTDIDECLSVDACPGPGTLSENTLGSYKCRCQLGYQGRSPTETDKRSLCEKIAEVDPNYTPWKIGYGILTCGFIFIIIGLIYIIFRLWKKPQ